MMSAYGLQKKIKTELAEMVKQGVSILQAELHNKSQWCDSESAYVLKL